MRNRTEALKVEKIDAICAMVIDRFNGVKAEMVENFLRQFFTNVAPQDLIDEEVENIFGAAISIWNYGRERKPNQPRIRAYNPRFEEVGWQSSHTIIEIINDDMPFLVDSVTAAINRREMTVHLIIHPIIRVIRDQSGVVQTLLDKNSNAEFAVGESYMHLQVSEQTSSDDLASIEAELAHVLQDVRSAVEDWQAMRNTMINVIIELEKLSSKNENKDDLQEICAFLRWIEDNHFTFLGYRQYDYVGNGNNLRMEVVNNSGLGIIRAPEVSVFDGLRKIGSLPSKVRGFLLDSTPLLVMKANKVSTVHRSVPLESISVKKMDKFGKVIGEHRFIGLFTSVAYNESPKGIPLLRQRVQNIVRRAGLRPASHDEKALINILETYPRDELFHANEEDLFEISIGILHLQERQKIALFVYRDAFERFVTAFVFVPRDHYNTQLRQNFQAILSTAFNGEITAFNTMISDSVLARLHFIIATTRGEIPEVNIDDLEQRLIDAGRSWADKLHNVMVADMGEEASAKLRYRYISAFPTAYRESYLPHAAILDIERMEEIEEETLGINLFRPIGVDDDVLHLKLFHSNKPVPLSDVMPMLENMGVRVLSEVPFEIEGSGMKYPIWLHDFEMRLRGDNECELANIKKPFEEAFAAVWNNRMENDGFNGLVLNAGITWREITVIRAYAKYLRQAAFTFSQDYMEETLLVYAPIALLLVKLFAARFNPITASHDRKKIIADLTAKIHSALDGVTNLDQDKIMRRFLNLICSTLRTNFYQIGDDGKPKSYISFKLDSQSIQDLPLPRPLVEIWIYSPRVEAIHLRGGKVARGGVRWSDRREDFRTEILSLMKAQQVKNAVIVPVGSKGGFVVKRSLLGCSREEIQAEGIECYKTMISGMLDITDNISSTDIITPQDVVRYDGNDPYLVVAADKGTATFSDIANEVSQKYGFWLDDAFASGGSAGYDHKKMGITARGAWESVKRHFRELGHNIQSKEFTVVGCGDMSGDVFGNAMLLSKHVRLLGAFNHLHIFVDPNPDTSKSFKEHQRMFNLPRSSWSDYNTQLISNGGGIFDRAAKFVKLTPEIKTTFGISEDIVSPNELICMMLKVKTDLLWFGGIGTYIKSERENSADVYDRANDQVRINAKEIRAKVIGEGANLAITQLGRIEAALSGIKLNTDAIDNSAGVDCSDHEVNIKILLGAIIADGDMTLKQRDKLLETMTNDIAELVLADNYDQTQALSVASYKGLSLIDSQSRLMRKLERGHLKLNRQIEFLPDDEAIINRISEGRGLTRPELAILLAYAKMELYDDLLDSDLPDDPALANDLALYFPEILRKKYSKAIIEHRLRREIIATSVTNSMINKVGATFLDIIHEQTATNSVDIARAFIIVREVFDMQKLWSAINNLDNKVPAVMQTKMLINIQQIVEHKTIWFLRNGRRPLDIASYVNDFYPGVSNLKSCLIEVIGDMERDNLRKVRSQLEDNGVPKTLSHEIASLEALFSACDIVRLASLIKLDVRTVAVVYFKVGTKFSLDWLRDKALEMVAETYWQKQAVNALVDDFYRHQSHLARKVLDHIKRVVIDSKEKSQQTNEHSKELISHNGDIISTDDAISCWSADCLHDVERTDRLLFEIRSNDHVDLAMLAVANGQMRSLLSR
ncbi:bacterial NAD-glutamate dehydrogenase family protein [Candidatus Endolissoclinum faulkneri L2]|uniref:Bacterial NAD-glutamate dehydrogenase family protein n=1 Tax=Candidatus Endolissoclinum faulkneri L2 TaxID=1193729 RepID=K7YN47_9PROT|nr:NAD-glutamate dehydrogenase [Candidatus Endolissoclinum faulkneri]AFX98917.1 bacterial NAD-glutamate dehydrogenase family protein [Candidatus Endolissoclinum faulkneri L2]